MKITHFIPWRFAVWAAATLGAVGFSNAAEKLPEGAPALTDFRDYGFMWWPDGWSSLDWSSSDRTPRKMVRCLQTGYYAMAMDTGGMRIEGLGPVKESKSYVQAAGSDDEAISSLPKAELNLAITANGKRYRCVRGAHPRLVDTGRFVQRGDIVGLLFTGDDGERLATKARLEVTAWPETLSFELEAGPDHPILPPGPAFGHTGGGFSFDGGNGLPIEGQPETDPDHLTAALWVFIPKGGLAENQGVYLLSKSWHDGIDGSYSFQVNGPRLTAVMNIGGKVFRADAAKALSEEKWIHVAMTFNGKTLDLLVDGKTTAQVAVNLSRTKTKPGEGVLCLAQRGDQWGRKFKGVIDDFGLFSQALSADQVAALAQGKMADLPRPALFRNFDEGKAESRTQKAEWQEALLEIELVYAGRTFKAAKALEAGGTLKVGDLRKVGLNVHPAKPEVAVKEPAGVSLSAQDPLNRKPVEARWIANNACYQIDMPRGTPSDNRRDYFDSAVFQVENTTDQPIAAPLWFNQAPCKDAIGVSPVLRELDGTPTGIPVQISKDWHDLPDGAPYNKSWLHAYTVLRVPPRTTVKYRLDMAHAYWGTLPAASHGQLSLIGWDRRADQQWDQVAIGSWGEMICYDPEVCLFRAFIDDLRPLFVDGTAGVKWDWSNNVGGGEFYSGQRLQGWKTAYLRYCPVATEVTYFGSAKDKSLRARYTVSTVRSNDYARHFHTIRYEVKAPVNVGKSVFYSVGAPGYNDNEYDKAARGNAAGMVEEWSIPQGKYERSGIPAEGEGAWFSLHGVRPVPVTRKPPSLGGAARGLIVRSWKARLGGKDTPVPYFAFAGSGPAAMLQLTAPPGVTELVPGDFLETTLELVVFPAVGSEYYGPDEAFKAILKEGANTWKPVFSEAKVGTGLKVAPATGELQRLFPLVLKAKDNRAEFSLIGSLGYAPITFTGLTGYRNPVLEVKAADGNWRKVDQSKQGNDFWQVDYDADNRCWSITYTVPPEILNPKQSKHEIRFHLEKGPH
jgi:hypothetical protein